MSVEKKFLKEMLKIIFIRFNFTFSSFQNIFHFKGSLEQGFSTIPSLLNFLKNFKGHDGWKN